ncbi:MAG TPA: bifunctional 5,10-methylenetetrahydrofolate dehydrogenase/5,10-methenyltetrahydrofolate cyclohydrolase [bacterium]|nr:bifunctional 5,10-methylenetetrahydrofolate dehydrogenase/5,10-methenyltetrahydrofolate cyclohydrolase [bacterium]
MIVMSGKEVGTALEADLTEEVAALKAAGVEPRLAVVLVGDNPESQTYVGTKVRTARRLGIESEDFHLPAETSQAELEGQLQRLNADPAVHGVLCQLPLPGHLDATRIAGLINPLKDVDCFHPFNFGLLAEGTPRFTPCTPAGILAMLRHYRIVVAGRHVVMLGRSNIVGRPMSLLLSQKGWDATVTVCHSLTGDLARYTRQADVLIAAIGRPEWVGPDHVREGAVVIDVGVHRVTDASRPRGYRICGDVAYDAVMPLVSAMTPVPGGVGLLTVLMLMRNTLLAARLAAGLDKAPGMGVK